MTQEILPPGTEPVVPKPKLLWTIRVYPNSGDATMTYHVDTWEDVKRVVAQHIVGYIVRKVEIEGP